MGSRRGTAHHLPLGRFAVPDPDDPDRMTYWRVEATNASGSLKELRPWPADVRWAPWRPDYPEGLDAGQRREWGQRWYDEVYFAWKEDVIAAIFRDPQGAADEFARSAPDADLPAPVARRKRVRVRPRQVSRKQREMQAQALLALALQRAGLSERQIAGETGLAKTTVHRRLDGADVAEGMEQVMLEVRICQLVDQLRQASLTAGPNDVPKLIVQLERIKRLQAAAQGIAGVDGRVPAFTSRLLDGGQG